MLALSLHRSSDGYRQEKLISLKSVPINAVLSMAAVQKQPSSRDASQPIA